MNYRLFKMLFVFFFISLGALKAQSTKAAIDWKSAKEMDSVKGGMIFVDMYTGWCGWCKQLDRTTFEDSNFVKYLKAHYTPVKFDAESKDTIKYNNTNFNFNPQYNVNGLALQLSGGRLSFPMIFIIDPKTHEAYSFPGYRSAKDFEVFLKFFATNMDKNKFQFQEYAKGFIAEWQ